MSSPLVQFSGQGPGIRLPSRLDPSMLKSLAGRHQPPALTRTFVVSLPASCPPLRTTNGRPADSPKAIVFERPSTASAIRDLVFFGSMPDQAPAVVVSPATVASFRPVEPSRVSTPRIGE